MIIPAIRDIKEYEKVLESEHPMIALLETRLSQLDSLVKYAHKRGKKVLVHADLVQGLKSDEYGIEFLVNNVKVDGVISTKGSVISLVKKHQITAIQRLFALDSYALEHNLEMCKRIKPDYIEILPGIIPGIIKQVQGETGIPVIAGGLIRTEQEVKEAFENGAKAVTTSEDQLWDL